MSDYDKDLAIRKAQERSALSEESIRIKANAHRVDQFRERFPQQIEHCVRLTAERLQLGLKKDTGYLSNKEVAELSTALAALYSIWIDTRAS